MPDYRSWTTTRGHTTAGARALWRATVMTDMNARSREAWKPDRQRHASAALKAYRALATSAANCTGRDVSNL